MKVLLRNNWFAPNGTLYRRSRPASAPVSVPDEYAAILPKSAKVVDAAAPAPQPAPEVNPAHALDVGRVSAHLAAQAQAEAEAAEAAAEEARKAKLAAKAAEREKALAEERAEAAKTKK